MNEIVYVDMEQYGLDESKARDVKKDFDAVLKIAVELEDEYNALIAQTEITENLCKKAKELRLKYVKVRTAIAAVHKERKAFYLSGGRAVDGLKNAYTHAVTGNEERLKEIETHFEKIEEQKRIALHRERANMLSAFEVYDVPDLSRMSDDVWTHYLTGVESSYKAKKEAEAKAELDRITKKKTKAEERERIRIENEKLRREREDMLKKAEAERAERAKKEQEERDRLAKIEAEREAERKAADQKLAAERAERAKIEAELKAKAEQAESDRIALAKREADIEHRRKINNAALEALVNLVDGVTPEMAKNIVLQIAKGNIPSVKINY